MRQAKSSRGFTLLEVLIATVVLAISLSGLYVLLHSSIRTTDALLKEVALLEASNDLLYRAYRGRITSTEMGEFESLSGYEGIKYRIERRPIGIADIYEYQLRLKKDGKEVVYRYYK
ncbi:MAG: prepilin-type N-terminal cleavage/methylation domain-containing protein [Nitrospirae bacterium]|nr:MAG: prepilin-type N-terminal cleavage/methylation domain-containing protein [Nitrospirota bacterium]